MAASRTRERLLEAAARLFHEKGYAATGNAGILAAAGTGASSLYHGFQSKEGLLAAVLDRLEARLQTEILAPSAAAAADPVEQVFALLGFYRGFLAANECRLGCPVGNLAGELADSHPEIRARLDTLFALWRGAVSERVAKVRDRLPSGISPADLGIFVLAVMEGGVMQARVAKSLAPFDTCVAILRKTFDCILTTESQANKKGPESC